MVDITDIEFRCYHCNYIQKTKTKISRFTCGSCGSKIYITKALKLMATKNDDWYNDKAEEFWARKNKNLEDAKKMYEDSLEK